MQKQPAATCTELQTAIKRRIDGRAKRHFVAHRIDVATPQPVQKMRTCVARGVFTCFEAGDFGFRLRRQLTVGVALRQGFWAETVKLKS